MYIIITLAIVLPVIIMHYGNHFYAAKTKTSQVPAPELAPLKKYQ